MVISKDITTTHPYSPPPSFAPQLISRTGTLKAESSVGSEEEFGKLRTDFSSSKSENYDNMFMEDVRLSPQRNATPTIADSESLGYRSYRPFRIISAKVSSGLDSRITFGDLFGLLRVTTRNLTDRRDWVGQLRVLRIVGIGHGWVLVLPSLTILLEFVNFRQTPVESRVGNRRGCVNIGHLCVSPHPLCRLWQVLTTAFRPKDFQKSLATDAIQGVDIYHQLSRLRHGKNLPDAEVELMMRTFAENLQNYDQVVEVGTLRRIVPNPSR